MGTLSLVRFVALGVLLAFSSAAFAAERKVALVIGNSEYYHTAKLPNAPHDAAAMAFLLKDAGFDLVEVHNDVGASEFRRIIRLFGETARTADIALFYYAGHGLEFDGANFLVPTDARLATDLDVEDEAISLDRVMRALEPARRLRLVILDACRDNPFIKQIKRISATRSIGRGLARVDPLSSDTLVAFAAKAGSVAADGDGRNSPFTEALLKHLTAPGSTFVSLLAGCVMRCLRKREAGRSRSFTARSAVQPSRSRQPPWRRILQTLRSRPLPIRNPWRGAITSLPSALPPRRRGTFF